MAMNFPDAPTTGDIYGPYEWDGEKWVTTGSGDGGGSGGGGLDQDAADLRYVNLTGDIMSGVLQAPWFSADGYSIGESGGNFATTQDAITSIWNGTHTYEAIRIGGTFTDYLNNVHTFKSGDGLATYLTVAAMAITSLVPIRLPSAPNSAEEAATKGYVDSAIAAGGGGGGEGGAYLPLTGGQLTGPLVVPLSTALNAVSLGFGVGNTGFNGDLGISISMVVGGTESAKFEQQAWSVYVPINTWYVPSLQSHLVNKGYVDAAIAAGGGGGGEGGAYLPLAGGTLTGPLSAPSYQIGGVSFATTEVVDGIVNTKIWNGDGTRSAIEFGSGTSDYTKYRSNSHNFNSEDGNTLLSMGPTNIDAWIAISQWVEPTDARHLATKGYVDAATGGGGGGAYLPLTGGMVTGDLAVTGQLSSPTVYGKTVTVDGPDDYSTGGWIAVDRWQDGLTAEIVGKKSGVRRWDIVLGNADPDGFPNENWEGSNFEIASYDNFGRNRDINFKIDRYSGKATVHSDPLEPMGIATKNYVDVRLGMIHVKDTKPAVQENVLWWDNVEGQLYIQVYDLDYTYQWVQAVPDPYYMLKTTGGSMTGALLLAADPAQPLEAATKQYVDTAVAGGGAEPLAIPFSFPGKPAPGAIINIPVAFPIALGQWLGGSVSCSGVAATSAAKFRLFKVDAAGVETEIGAVDFDSSRPNGGWSGVSGSLATGEVLRMKAPDVQDATLADVGLTVWATRA